MKNEKRIEAQSELFGTVFVLAQHLARRTDEVMEPTGVTTKQWLLLAILAKKFPGQAPTLSEAASCYGSSRQNVKQLARQLETRGFLRLVSDPTDRRVLRLELTDQVSELDRPEETRRQLGLLEELFACFSNEEIHSLQELLTRWCAAIS